MWHLHLPGRRREERPRKLQTEKSRHDMKEWHYGLAMIRAVNEEVKGSSNDSEMNTRRIRKCDYSHTEAKKPRLSLLLC